MLRIRSLVCLCDIRTSSVSHRGIVVTTASRENKKEQEGEGMNEDEGSGGLNTDGRRFGQQNQTRTENWEAFGVSERKLIQKG